MKNILLLGSSGLISPEIYHIIESSENEYQVEIAGRANPNTFNSYFFWDMFKTDSVLYDNLKKEYDAVVVSAWYGNKSEDRNDFQKNSACAEALFESLCIIKSKSAIKQIILLGSQEEYSEKKDIVDELHEEDESKLSAYGKAKLMLYNRLCMSFSDVLITELRFHSVFGKKSEKKQLITDVINDMLNKKSEISFYSDGNNFYDFLFYKDAAAAVINIIKNKKSGVFNLSSGEKKLFSDYINDLSCITQYKGKITFGSQKSANYYFDSTKFRNAFKWTPAYSFEAAVKEVIDDILINMLYKEDVIIYGAGYCGLVFSDMLLRKGIMPKYFLDNSLLKQGRSFNNIKIISPKEIDYTDSVVIICILNSDYFNDIKETLKKYGITKVFSIYEISSHNALFDYQPLIFNVSENWRKDRKDKLDEVVMLLSDEESVDTYNKILENICDDRDTKIPSHSFEDQYFAYDVYKQTENEIFLDCGAFKGDVLRYFLNRNSSFKEYWAIEPDEANYIRIESEFNDSRIHIIKQALSDNQEYLFMKNYMNENSIVTDSGFTVPANTLDNICNEMKIEPTFIKIDVEGYEEKLLNGAINIIQKYQPLIAMAIYHRCDDLWKLPLMIHQILPSHKLFIRSYMNVNETILYAIPKERLINEISDGY